MKNLKLILFSLGVMISGAIIGQTEVTGVGVYVPELDKTIVCTSVSQVGEPEDTDGATVSLTGIMGATDGNIADPGTLDYVVLGEYGGQWSDGTINCKGHGLCISVYTSQIFFWN